MTDTSISLLDRLRDASDAEAWERLVRVYRPVIRRWLDRLGLPPQDADDLVQDVLAVLVRRIGEFHREPRIGAFRAWLRTITVNCVREAWRRRKKQPRGTGKSDVAQLLGQLEDPDSGLSRDWDEEHDRVVMQQLLEEVRPDFAASTWLAFHRVAIENRSPRQVALELGISENAVFIAKSRVLARLRREGAKLIENP